MNSLKNLPLTETTAYILLALIEPAHGYLIIKKVEWLSNGKVKLAAGTLYGAIENLIRLKFIKSVPNQDKRRKVYLITELGIKILKENLDRQKHLVEITERNLL